MKLQHKLLTTFFVLSLFFPMLAFAGGGHHHGEDGSHAPIGKLTTTGILNISQTQIGVLVNKKVPVENKTLDVSWKHVEKKKMKIQTLKHKFLRVEVKHPTNGTKLFLLLSPKGELRSANHTGTFKGLN